MNVNPPLSLKEEYGRSRKRSRKSSTSGSAILVYEDACLGDPFFYQVLGTHRNPKHESLFNPIRPRDNCRCGAENVGFLRPILQPCDSHLLGGL